MNISLRPFDYSSDEDCQLLVKWHNDPALRILVAPTRPEHPYREATVEKVREWNSQRGKFKAFHDLMILAGGRSIGSLQIILNPPHKRSQHNIAWPSIVIGEPEYRRRGIGTGVARHIASLAFAMGATHVEAGVFEHNAAIRAFLEKHGFREIARIVDFTWHEGRPWADVRYEKALP